VFRIKATIFYKKNTLKKEGKETSQQLINICKSTDNKLGRYSDWSGDNKGIKASGRKHP
jgi:hypothetical protein